MPFDGKIYYQKLRFHLLVGFNKRFSFPRWISTLQFLEILFTEPLTYRRETVF